MIQEFYHTICLINDSPAHTLIGSSTKPFHQPASPQIALQVPCLHFLKQSLTISTDSDPENCFHSNRDQKKFNTSLRRSRLSEISFPRAANKTFLIQSWTNPLGKKKIWFRNSNRNKSRKFEIGLRSQTRCISAWDDQIARNRNPRSSLFGVTCYCYEKNSTQKK